MGFFKGVMQQLNLMDERKFQRESEQEAREFQRSLAQEQRDFQVSQAEADRAFQREVAERSLAEQRRSMLLQIIPNLTPEQAAALSRMNGGEPVRVGDGAPVSPVGADSPGLTQDRSPVPSQEALTEASIFIEEFGVEPEAIAPFAALSKAHVEEVRSAINEVRDQFQAAGRLDQFTPDVVTEVMSKIRILVEEGKDVDVADLARIAGTDNLSQSDLAIMDILATRPDTVRVISDYQPRFPIEATKLNQIQTGFIAQMQQDLEMTVADLQAKQRQGDNVANQLTRASAALDYIKESGTATYSIIQEFGVPTFRALVESEPSLMYGTGLPGALGAARRSLENATFSSMEEAQAAIDAGTIPEGATVYVNGRSFTVGQ